ncbi:hypothetical protein MPTK2_7g12050 [Marchantia polymorpha subsp. ruderalis]
MRVSKPMCFVVLHIPRGSNFTKMDIARSVQGHEVLRVAYGSEVNLRWHLRRACLLVESYKEDGSTIRSFKDCAFSTFDDDHQIWRCGLG